MAKPKSQNPESTFKSTHLTTKCRKLSDHSKRTSGARGALGATPRTRHGTFTTIKQKPALRDRKVSPPSQPTRPRRPQNGKKNFLKTSFLRTTMFSGEDDWKRMHACSTDTLGSSSPQGVGGMLFAIRVRKGNNKS